VEIIEDFEVTISIPGAREEIIEAAEVGLSKIFIGMLVEGLQGQVVDSTTALETSLLNTLLLNNHTRNKQALTMEHLSIMFKLRRKRTARTYSDLPKSCKLRIRKLPRRKRTSRCLRQADQLLRGHKASRTRQSLALPSRDPLKLPRLLPSLRSLKS
jgi:hypothetical protein